jgi:hypothetical protein
MDGRRGSEGQREIRGLNHGRADPGSTVCDPT